MRRSSLLPLVLAVGAVTLAACDQGGGTAAADVGPPTPGDTVRVLDNEFDADHLEVGVGDTVTWSWEGNAPHDVVGDDFGSEVLRSGDTFTHTFEQAGTFDYECTLHRGMTGRVTVAEA